MVNKDKISSRKAKAIATKNKIYECASQLFKEYGFNNVSVDSIVKMAGVSKGSFYVYFSSKYALITTQISDYVNQMDLDYKSYLESFPAGTMTSAKLISLVGKIVDVIVLTIGYDHIRIIYEAQITKTIKTEAILDYNRDIYKIFSSMILQGIEQREFKPEMNSEIMANHFIMSIRGMTYEWCIRYPDFNLKDQVVDHIEIILAGMKK